MKVQRGKGREDDSYTIKTSAFNEKPELMGLECRNCGGVLELTDRTHAVCPYCGQKYLIDEAKGTVINIQVDYSGNNEMRQAVNSARNALIIFLSVAAVLVVIILGFNIAAKKSVFSSSDSDLPGGQLLRLFLRTYSGRSTRTSPPRSWRASATSNVLMRMRRERALTPSHTASRTTRTVKARKNFRIP